MTVLLSDKNVKKNKISKSKKKLSHRQIVRTLNGK